jgi:hypothetical protein
MNPCIRMDYFARDTCGLALATTDAPDWPQDAASASPCRFRPIPSLAMSPVENGHLAGSGAQIWPWLHAMSGWSAQRRVEWLADKPRASRWYDRQGRTRSIASLSKLARNTFRLAVVRYCRQQAASLRGQTLAL